MITFPLVVTVVDERSLELLRDSLMAMRGALLKDWEMWMNADAERLVAVKRDIDRVEELLNQTGFSASGPRRVA